MLNAKDFGIPQNRERVFIVSIRKDIDDKTFKFPEPKELKLTLKDVLDEKIEDKYIMNNDFIIYDTPKGSVIGEVDIKGTEQIKRIYDKCQYAPTLSTMQGGHREPKVILEEKQKVRKLTPIECWRLMGFDDEDYWKARKRLENVFYNGNDRSNSQMYKQAGNSIVVNVLEEIFKSLLL